MNRERWSIRVVARQDGGPGSNAQDSHTLDLSWTCETRAEIEQALDDAMIVIAAVPRRAD